MVANTVAKTLVEDNWVDDVWARLCRIRSLTLSTRRQGQGRGGVQVKWLGDACLVFRERGFWCHSQGGEGETVFRNVYRWTRAADGSRIHLDHLRYGMEHSVRLGSFLGENARAGRLCRPFLCGSDTYDAELDLLVEGLQLQWEIRGPKKCTRLVSTYATQEVQSQGK